MSFSKTWNTICHISELIENSGVCALVKQKQIAIFSVPAHEQQVFALDNFDPIGQANVLYRGIVGCNQGELVVSSPLYKQHFSLLSGKCLQQEAEVTAYPTRIENQQVQIYA